MTHRLHATPTPRPRGHEHPACLPDDELLRACDTVRGRASGPGGQHRNKVETAIELTHRSSGVSAAASERRSQSENLRVALRRLRVNLALAVRGEGSHRAGPSELWLSRVRGGRIVLSPEHADFPLMLAEALDVLAFRAWEPAEAGATLCCTASQLVKLLKDEPRALAAVNRMREASGRHPLR
jgi:hypothetical protein